MNLHDIAFRITNAALWLTVVGRNGRSIGDHLWVLAEGEPPEFDSSNYQPWNRNYWTPTRFSWAPFGFQNLFAGGYVPPLCGRRSNSLRPRISDGWGNDPCTRCMDIAISRGIIPLTYRTARENSAVFALVRSEMLAWQAAGRPQEWPLPSPAN